MLPCLIAEPVQWDVEYRCFVLEGRVATLSPYLRAGELVQTPDGNWPAPPVEARDASEFAAAMLADPTINVPPAVVVDVGRIRGKGWSIVEANPAWSSGLYGCDPVQVLAVLQRGCVPQDTMASADRLWVLSRDSV